MLPLSKQLQKYHLSIPLCIPGKDYPIPTDAWTQDDWNKHFCCYCIHPLPALFQLHNLKKVERRTREIPASVLNKTVIVKTCKHDININYVSDRLDDKYVKKCIGSVPFLKKQQHEYYWWVEELRKISDSFLFICQFTTEPIPNQTYSFISMGQDDFPHIWYIKKLTPLQGYSGFKNPCQGYGNQGSLTISKEAIKILIRGHISQFQVKMNFFSGGTEKTRTFITSVSFSENSQKTRRIH